MNSATKKNATTRMRRKARHVLRDDYSKILQLFQIHFSALAFMSNLLS